ncbi:MAG: glycine/D-amino acid oxidase-like deaminating enzyme [Cognaticolwellia sp.]|jgi:glycine/D-amino acid oxidase-like deaminating enzyme
MSEVIPPCDVAVIGGGLSGLLCALYLARAGVRVMVLDADPMAFGSQASSASLASLGLVQLGTAEHPHRLAHALGVERAREYLAFSQRSIALLAQEVPMERGGLRVGMGEEIGELEEAVRISEALGVASSLWTRDQVSQSQGSAGLGPARYVPLDGRLDPSQALALLAEKARAAGAHLFAGRRVKAVELDGSITLRMETGETRCELVVYAASWGMRALDSWFSDKLYPVRAAILETEPSSGGPSSPQPLQGASAQYGYLSWQRTPLGSLRVSGARWATPHMETGETERRPSPKVQAALRGFLQKTFVQDAQAGVTASAGIQGYTCDNLPLVGPLPGARRVACTGFADTGWSLAAAGAEIITQGILGERPEYPDFLKPQRLVGI